MEKNLSCAQEDSSRISSKYTRTPYDPLFSPNPIYRDLTMSSLFLLGVVGYMDQLPFDTIKSIKLMHVKLLEFLSSAQNNMF
jgi:hypothetical protein